MNATRSLSALLLVGLVPACGDGLPGTPPTPDAEPCTPAEQPPPDCSDPCFDDRGPELRMEISADDLLLPAPPAGSTPVPVGIFYAVAPQERDSWTRNDAIRTIRELLYWTSDILAQCEMHAEAETVQVIAVPARLLDHQGNEEGSFGGHPPKGTPDPDLFDYEQNERLTADSRELFTYGKQHTSKNTIAAFTVSNIVYYANQQLDAAGGLSYPPNIYHHPDDYPYRNSVLLVPAYGACGDLPGTVDRRTLAHEIAHMLFNTGGHAGAEDNLLVDGSVLTPEQCATMHENLGALFGEAEVPDPGPPD